MYPDVATHIVLISYTLDGQVRLVVIEVHTLRSILKHNPRHHKIQDVHH